MNGVVASHLWPQPESLSKKRASLSASLRFSQRKLEPFRVVCSNNLKCACVCVLNERERVFNWASACECGVSVPKRERERVKEAYLSVS